MQAQLVEALQEAGLSKNETKVYLALLQLSTGTAVQITGASKVHRVNVYDALERLKEKGLISVIMKGNKRIYEAADPQYLMQLIKQKETLLEQVMPSLKQSYELQKDPQQVHYFVGVDSIMQAYNMVLDQDDKVLYGIGGSGETRAQLKHRHVHWNKQRIEAGIKIKALYYEFTRTEKARTWSPEDLAEIRYIPDEFLSESLTDICGNLVIHVLPKKDQIMAIVIENRAIADSFKQFFRFMWQVAKP